MPQRSKRLFRFLVGLFGGLAILCVVTAAEWALWTAPNITAAGALAGTGFILICLALVAILGVVE